MLNEFVNWNWLANQTVSPYFLSFKSKELYYNSFFLLCKWYAKVFIRNAKTKCLFKIVIYKSKIVSFFFPNRKQTIQLHVLIFLNNINWESRNFKNKSHKSPVNGYSSSGENYITTTSAKTVEERLMAIWTMTELSQSISSSHIVIYSLHAAHSRRLLSRVMHQPLALPKLPEFTFLAFHCRNCQTELSWPELSFNIWAFLWRKISKIFSFQLEFLKVYLQTLWFYMWILNFDNKCLSEWFGRTEPTQTNG